MLVAGLRLLPQGLRKLFTWDQGSEMLSHLGATSDTGILVYIRFPSSAWQRDYLENPATVYFKT